LLQSTVSERPSNQGLIGQAINFRRRLREEPAETSLNDGTVLLLLETPLTDSEDAKGKTTGQVNHWSNLPG
jgi:hypothetical protein